uniref:C3H1-type domain-containing protein n=2 Tax=Caenorhabditis japonica TaxID=281687 RepID=A0A8R1DH06_CAEJA
MSTGSADSGVFSSGVHVSPSHSQRSESAGSQSGPPSPTAQLNTLLFQTANLLAVNEQLKKEIAENKQIQNIQMRTLNRISGTGTGTGPPDQFGSHSSHPNISQRSITRGERRMQKPESYKTVICQAWLESKMCTFAENCRFAHGEEELRPSKIEPRQNNKYKTKLCDKYTTTGLCPYGKRCLFIHPDHGPNAYIRADKLFEVSQRHALADLRDQMETQIMTGGRNAFCQLPPMAPETPFATKSTGNANPNQQVISRGPSCENADKNGARPHPSWPLESSSFFAPETMIARPISPFEPVFSSGPLPYFLTGDQRSGPFASNHLPSVRSQPDDDSMTFTGGFDHLAEDMAKHLELW